MQKTSDRTIRLSKMAATYHHQVCQLYHLERLCIPRVVYLLADTQNCTLTDKYLHGGGHQNCMGIVRPRSLGSQVGLSVALARIGEGEPAQDLDDLGIDI